MRPSKVRGEDRLTMRFAICGCGEREGCSGRAVSKPGSRRQPARCLLLGPSLSPITTHRLNVIKSLSLLQTQLCDADTKLGCERIESVSAPRRVRAVRLQIAAQANVAYTQKSQRL